MKSPRSLWTLPLLFPMPMTIAPPPLLPGPPLVERSAPVERMAPPAWCLSTSERDDLARAEMNAPELGNLRGGETDNDTLTTVLIVLAIVALVVIIV